MSGRMLHCAACFAVFHNASIINFLYPAAVRICVSYSGHKRVSSIRQAGIFVSEEREDIRCSSHNGIHRAFTAICDVCRQGPQGCQPDRYSDMSIGHTQKILLHKDIR
ncbi:hypothetical protein [Thermoplasma acidophilum]|uniref:Uncharacterized protein n=1 Tax=Thermoplasma acidophilum (strain ATCC 25905 / DSM 1728 / JCM 9062 / NBRC 15155 / AMRC-C165) TaxID=273075 RepID=Q9HLI5_THEAC|nr:hypothetical protein [Thermoplasma acidophilum]